MTDDASTTPQMLTVEGRAHGWRLDHYLTRIFPNHSRGQFQKAIAAETVLVNGLPVKASRRLRVNDRVSVRLPEEPDSTITPEDIPLDVIFEDEFIAVINKQADLITHPGKSNFTGTLAAAVQHHFDQLSDVAGQLRPGIVHRLDRDTTGVIIIAKNNQVHHQLTRQFEQRTVEKEYRALAYGKLDRDADIVTTHVKTHPKAREKMVVCPPGNNTREAVTRYNVLERFDRFVYVQLLPKTGRTHQLRVHLQHLKAPIIADRLYSGRESLMPSEVNSLDTSEDETALISRQALHAFRLKIRHPVTDAIMEFEAPFPDDFQRTLNALQEQRKPH
ncbi:RluA family pseudouridine synthase [Thalassoglobus sp. JC818]|uniref:RluA family pseudouridine synthase n=1 Tax=Thalassoglobus sp. JC818 TaxID=3232136 RepID=UPI003459FA88